MWKTIYSYEIRYLFRLPFSYLLLLGAFSMSCLLMLGTGGYLDGTSNIDTEVVTLNSAHQLTNISFFFIKSILFIIPIIIGLTLHKDISTKMYQVLYAYPLIKLDYILGKFLAVATIVFLTALLLTLGIICGELIMGVENPFIRSFSLIAHLNSLFIIQLPTLLSASLLIFAVVGITRSQYSGFILVVIIQLFQIILENIIFNSPNLLGLLDPYGQNTFYLISSKWSTEMINSRALPIKAISIYNKLLWTILAFAVFYYYYQQFDFNVEFPSKRNKSTKQKKSISPLVNTQKRILSPLSMDFGYVASIKTTWHMSLRGFIKSVFNWMFITMLGFGIFSIFVIQIKTSHTGEFTLQAFTSLLISTPLQVYMFIVLLSSFLSTGRLVLEDKQTGINELIDASPISNLQLFVSKFLSISYTQIFMLLCFIIVGMIVQLINGVYTFELGLYFKHIFLVVFPSLALWTLTSICAFTFISNFYFGVISLMGLLILPEALRQIKISTYLLSVNNTPQMKYNDLYHYGASSEGFKLVLLYWALFVLTVSTIAFFYWQRGITDSIIDRINTSYKNISKIGFALLVIFIIGTTITGFKIFKAEQINKTQDAVFSKTKLETFKKEWSDYANIVQPIITDILLNLELYPGNSSFSCSAKYILKNVSQKKIDTLLIRTGFDEKTELHLNQPFEFIVQNEAMKHNLLKLKNGIPPGDSIHVNFDIQSMDNQLLKRNSSVIKNGTYLRNDILPRFSYQFKNDKQRNDIDSTIHFYADDSHHINLETIICTDENQIAIAPGRLSSQTNENNRAIYHYKTDHPLKFNFSFQSGIFEVYSEVYQGRNIEVYAHSKHRKHVNDMVAGIRASLNYNESAFTKYPYNDIRIIEFPSTEGDYSATLMANNIPCNEILFSLNNEKMKTKLNLPFYVMAHELTHEWFGNQLMPAKGPGAKMLTESITEFLTLNVYETNLGVEKKRTFLEIQLNRYFDGKRSAGKTEQPLYKVEDTQEYIAYGKGTLALNRLAQTIGNQQMVDILSSFLSKYGTKRIYPNGQDFVQFLYEQIQIDHHELIKELFEQIVTYDNKILEVRKLNERELEILVNISCEGADSSIEKIEVAQTDFNENIIQINSYEVQEGNTIIELPMNKNTRQIILDPNLIYMDSDRDNNVMQL